MTPITPSQLNNDDRVVRSPCLTNEQWKELIEKVKRLDEVRDLDQSQSQYGAQ